MHSQKNQFLWPFWCKLAISKYVTETVVSYLIFKRYFRALCPVSVRSKIYLITNLKCHSSKQLQLSTKLQWSPVCAHYLSWLNFVFQNIVYHLFRNIIYFFNHFLLSAIGRMTVQKSSVNILIHILHFRALKNINTFTNFCRM